MSHEILSYSETDIVPTLFETMIADRIEELGDQNKATIDRYSPQQRVEPSISQTFRKNGKVDFGELWQVHRVEVDDKELVYAYLPPTVYLPDDLFDFLDLTGGETKPTKKNPPNPAKAEFYINEFNDRGLVARNTFTGREGSYLYRSLTERFDIGRYSAGVLVQSRQLLPYEETQLEKVIRLPEDNVFAIRSLVKVTDEERESFTQKIDAQQKREAESQERLAEIARYHAMPIRDDIIIG